jgi:hypothetical protein
MNNSTALNITDNEEKIVLTPEEIVWKSIVLFIVLFISALCNGFNVGIFGLDLKYLEMLIKGPHETEHDLKESHRAKRIYFFLKRGNLMLCATLIVNTFC